MAHIITDLCKGHKYTDCVVVCPVDAFHELPDMLVINPDSCIDCGACVSECPVKAIFPEEQLPSDKVEFIEFNKIQSMSHQVIAQKKI